MHEGLEPFLDAGPLPQSQIRGVLFPGAAESVLKNFGIESLFVPKMIIDRSDVRPGAMTNFPHGSRAESPLGEHLARGVQQKLARGRLCRIYFCLVSRRTHFKHLFKTSV